MDYGEQQQEEILVLQSIYEGDENFKVLDNQKMQCKFSMQDGSASCILEIIWGSNYPDSAPTVNMDTFHNKLMKKSVKERIATQLCEVAAENVGAAMTYTLFEWLRENADQLLTVTEADLLADDVSGLVIGQVQEEGGERDGSPENKQQQSEGQSTKQAKKPQLSKAQKRKLTNQLNSQGERPRGWDWIDVVKHLSQTGSSRHEGSPSPGAVTT